jgi:hypothetical protein
MATRHVKYGTEIYRNKTRNILVTLRRVRAAPVAEYYTTSVCILALGIYHAMRMRHVVICGLPRSITF